jgi:hypothetical protein
MENTNKITDEQLQTIIRHQKEMNGVLVNIGLLESQKHGLLHQIAEVNKELESFKVELQNQYGHININVEDGSYTVIEKDEPTNLEVVK